MNPETLVTCRWFTLQDVELLEDDVDAMRILFHAEGEGVPREAVQMTTAPLDELLTVLALDTPTLTANFRQVGLTCMCLSTETTAASQAVAESSTAARGQASRQCLTQSRLQQTAAVFEEPLHLVSYCCPS